MEDGAASRTERGLRLSLGGQSWGFFEMLRWANSLKEVSWYTSRYSRSSNSWYGTSRPSLSRKMSPGFVATSCALLISPVQNRFSDITARRGGMGTPEWNEYIAWSA